MNDSQIVELYWQRDEKAISETQKRYGRYCFSIAHSIIRRHEDAEECVNDTYLAAWNAIPPHRPEILSTFLGKITRRLSLKKIRLMTAKKRGGGAFELSVDELEDCIPSDQRIDEALTMEELTGIINRFVADLPLDERRVFIRRYWYFDPISDIASKYGFGKSKVKMMLKRTRDKLKALLEKEGVFV